jgi:hypothetical protein
MIICMTTAHEMTGVGDWLHVTVIDQSRIQAGISLYSFVHCVCNYYGVYCFECVCVVLCMVLCIVVPLPPGTYPLAVNNNNNKTKLRDTGQHLGGGWGNRENINSSR